VSEPPARVRRPERAVGRDGERVKVERGRREREGGTRRGRGRKRKGEAVLGLVPRARRPVSCELRGDGVVKGEVDGRSCDKVKLGQERQAMPSHSFRDPRLGIGKLPVSRSSIRRRRSVKRRKKRKKEKGKTKSNGKSVAVLDTRKVQGWWMVGGG
jgi:hypothetical protein